MAIDNGQGLVATSRPNPEQRVVKARLYNDQARKASRDVWTLVHQSIREMFGVAVAAAIEAPLEQVTENYGEAVYEYEEALRATADRHATESAFLRFETSVVRSELLHAKNVLREAVADTKTRFGKNGRTLPAWIAAAEQALLTWVPAGEPAASSDEPF